jgi:CHAT domain-containing protein
VDAWREQADGRAIVRGTTLAEAEREYRLKAAQLRRRVWDPIAAHVGGASRVFVVPDGALSLISFSALPIGRDRYLLDDGPTLHYLATERDLVPSEAPPPGRGLLAVGGAAFDEAGPPGSISRAPTGAGCRSLAAAHFEPLPGTTNEVSDLARLWPSASGATADDVLVLSGRGATKTAVTRAVAGKRVVHLATHGFFLQPGCDSHPGGTRAVGALASGSSATPVLVDNPLLLSGLAFAGANRSGAGHSGGVSGILTAEEVAGLNLQGTEWAVLSACNTGLGKIKAGEGVLGLRRAFQIAGARTIIMSLWSVEDQATRMWMRALYQERFLNGAATADAVRSASLQVLRSRRGHRQSTHPFYWAAFVAAGDWR